jgi:hypothetical protein
MRRGRRKAIHDARGRPFNSPISTPYSFMVSAAVGLEPREPFAKEIEPIVFFEWWAKPTNVFWRGHACGDVAVLDCEECRERK